MFLDFFGRIQVARIFIVMICIGLMAVTASAESLDQIFQDTTSAASLRQAGVLPRQIRSGSHRQSSFRRVLEGMIM